MIKSAPADLPSTQPTSLRPISPTTRPGDAPSRPEGGAGSRGFEQELAAVIDAPAIGLPTLPEAIQQRPAGFATGVSKGSDLPPPGKDLPTEATRVTVTFDEAASVAKEAVARALPAHSAQVEPDASASRNAVPAGAANAVAGDGPEPVAPTPTAAARITVPADELALRIDVGHPIKLDARLTTPARPAIPDEIVAVPTRPASTNPVQIFAEADAAEAPNETLEHAALSQRAVQSSASAAQALASPASDQPAPQSQAPALATAQPAPASSQAPAEARLDPRLGPQIETAIEQISDARQASRAARPEVLMRHGEFGLVSMRLDASTGDLRATLAARDPGFVPAVQAALAERAVAAASESAHTSGQRPQDHSAQSGSNPNGSGQGHASGHNYGSSPGSSQGSSQPRMHHHDDASRDPEDRAGDAAASAPPTPSRAGGVFA